MLQNEAVYHEHKKTWQKVSWISQTIRFDSCNIRSPWLCGRYSDYAVKQVVWRNFSRQFN